MDLKLGAVLIGLVAAPVIYGADARMHDISEDDIRPVAQQVQEFAKSAQQTLDSQLRMECMQYYHQELAVESRLIQCEKESYARKKWWAWEDCMKQKRDSCPIKPEQPPELR